MAKKIEAHRRARRWVASASALRGPLKKPAGFEKWFYDGPSLHFGHSPLKKKGGR